MNSAARRRFAYPCWLVSLLLCACVATLLLLLPSRDVVLVSAPAASPPPAFRRVTKSLAELTVPELSDHVLFFNRVPKSGSEMLVLLLQWLQGLNGFRHVRLSGGQLRKLSRMQQEELVEQVTQKVRDEAIPVSFDRHVYFVNFSRFDRQSPTYINLVRDPIDKAASRFYYARATPDPHNPDVSKAPPRKRIKLAEYKDFDHCVRKAGPECVYRTGHSYDLTIPYFCGHHDYCTVLNDQRALDAAKANVDRYFPVVGVLEELNITLALLEHQLPLFFKGVQRIYYQELQEPHKNKNRRRPQHVSRETRKELESVLDTEYEFYYWLRARLLRQHTALSTH